MTEQGYNGWANYPTWNVALWINNDQGSQEAAHEAVRAVDVAYPGGPTDPGEIERALAYRAGQALRCLIEESAAVESALSEATLTADLLGWALDSVDWTEIGAAFLADVEEQDRQ